MEKEKNFWHKAGEATGFFFVALVTIAFWAFLVQYFWNLVMPDLGLPRITFWQSVWLWFLMLVAFFLPLYFYIKGAVKSAIVDLSGKTQINITSNYDVDDIAELAEIWKEVSVEHEIGQDYYHE